MYKPLSKILITIIMLVAFIGQAMANHMVIFSDDVASFQFTQIQTVKNSATAKIATEAITSSSIEHEEDCCDVDCCEGDCACPANSCASSVYLENQLYLSMLFNTAEPVLSVQIQETYNLVNSLYRPPILPLWA